MDEVAKFYIQVGQARELVQKQKKQYNRSLPAETIITAPFWEGLKRHEFLIQKCVRCGTNIWYPRAWCYECGSRDLKWTRSNRKGKIYSFTVIRQVIENSPSWSTDIPFAVAEVELDEGVRIYGRLKPHPVHDVRVGRCVEVEFDDVSNDVTLFSFKLSD